MAYLVWRRGKYAELVRSVREDGRVRQERLAYLGARPVLTPALKARIERICPGEVDWPKVEAQILERGGRVVEQDHYTAPADARLILWAHFEAARRMQLRQGEPAPWERDEAPPQRPAIVAEREASRYLWPRFVRAMLDRPGLQKLLANQEALRREAWRLFHRLRDALDLARQMRAGKVRLEDLPAGSELAPLAQDMAAQMAEEEASREREERLRELWPGRRRRREG